MLLRSARTLVAAMMALSALAGCDPFNTQFDAVESARTYRAAGADTEPLSDDGPVVMSYNIKFGGGRVRFFFDCPGDRVILERTEVIEHLEGIARKIRQVDPDILLLQEVDINSKRSAYIDQVAWLLGHTQLDHAAYASQWRSRYIPRHGLGRVNSGNAILSKWPITRAKRHALPLIGTQSWLTQYFYLKRNVLTARINVPGWGRLWLANTHLSAFAKDDTQARQVNHILQIVRRLRARNGALVFGGDLNLLPPGTQKTSDFADESNCDDPSFETPSYAKRLHLLKPLYEQLTPAVPLEEYLRQPDEYYTYSGDPDVGWTRKLDYLFSSHGFAPDTVTTHQGTDPDAIPTLPLSDHAPLSAQPTH